MNEAELIRRAMSVLGKRTSERKKISSRKNAKRPRKKKAKALSKSNGVIVYPETGEAHICIDGKFIHAKTTV
jgi:hypothetical protein